MCLLEVYSDEDMNRIVEELPEVAPGVVRLTKCVFGGDNCWEAQNWLCDFKNGINTNTHLEKIKADDGKEYWSNYHFLSKPIQFPKSVQPFLPPGMKFISCLVKKDCIVAVGKQRARLKESMFSDEEVWGEDVLCFVASAAFFPTYPETEAKLEDFLAWLKENDPEYAENQLCEMAVK